MFLSLDLMVKFLLCYYFCYCLFYLYYFSFIFIVDTNVFCLFVVVFLNKKEKPLLLYDDNVIYNVMQHTDKILVM